MQTVNCVPTRRLKMSYWVDLLSLREPAGIEWWQKHQKWGLNIFIYSKTQLPVKKILCVLRQVIQSANCELTRRLKYVLVDQLGMLFCVEWNQPWMRNEPLRSPEHLICYSSCQWICILRQVMQWANCVPARLLRHWDKMKWIWKRVEVGSIF